MFIIAPLTSGPIRADRLWAQRRESRRSRSPTSICTFFFSRCGEVNAARNVSGDYHNDYVIIVVVRIIGGWTEMLYCKLKQHRLRVNLLRRARRNCTPCTTQQQLHPTTATTVHVFISRHATREDRVRCLTLMAPIAYRLVMCFSRAACPGHARPSRSSYYV